jgi:hypothetical protein
MIGEDGRAVTEFGRPPQLLAKARAIKNVVAKNEHRPVSADERLADHECLGEPAWRRLLGVVDPHAPVCAVAEQPAEQRQVVRRRDDQHLAYPREHHHRQRIIDHRLVVDRKKLLGDRKRDWLQPCACPAGQDDALHCSAPD